MVTSIENVQIGREVELPAFADGTPFVARIKSVSLINMICKNRIPNPLIKTVMDMMSDDDDKDSEKSEESRTESEKYEDKMNLFNLMIVIAKEVLVKPTYEDIEACGIELTDDQLFAIFEHSMSGINSASKFC